MQQEVKQEERPKIEISHDKIVLRNNDLQKKTENVQAEFDQLMDEIISRRTGKTGRGRMDDIYEDLYKPGSE